jgi:HEAT repeat protein
VRKAAEEAFSTLDPSLADKIIGYLRYSNYKLQRAAGNALNSMGWEPEGCEIAAWYYSAKGDYMLASDCGIYAIEPLLLCLNTNEIYGEESPYFLTANQIEEALVNSGGTEIQPLIDLFGVIHFKNSNPNIAESYAKETLTAIGKPAVPQLIDALSVYQENNLASIVKILGQIRDKRAVDPLLKILQYDDYKNARDAAANALLMMDEPQLVPVLINFLVGDDEELSSVVENTLVKYFSDDPSPLLPYLNNRNTLEVYLVLVRIGDPTTLPNLVAALRKFGNKEIATTFLNSGNSTLEAEAKEWAEDNGYRVFPGGGYSPGWGDN